MIRFVTQHTMLKSHARPLTKWADQRSVKGAIGELMAMVATELDREVIYAETPSKANHSPFGFAKEFTIVVDLAERLGFRFANVSDWLPVVIREHISGGPKRSRDPGLHAILDKLHQHEDVTAGELKYLRRRITQPERWARRQQ